VAWTACSCCVSCWLGQLLSPLGPASCCGWTCILIRRKQLLISCGVVLRRDTDDPRYHLPSLLGNRWTAAVAVNAALLDMPADAWHVITSRDWSTLGRLYAPFRCRVAVLAAPTLLLLCGAATVASVFAGNPDSMTHLGSVAAVELATLAVIALAAPFSHAAANALLLGTSTCQLVLLSLQAFARIGRYNADPLVFRAGSAGAHYTVSWDAGAISVSASHVDFFAVEVSMMVFALAWSAVVLSLGIVAAVVRAVSWWETSRGGRAPRGQGRRSRR
jgi:hypothetical protein